jgi:hypothetical protein
MDLMGWGLPERKVKKAEGRRQKAEGREYIFIYIHDSRFTIDD